MVAMVWTAFVIIIAVIICIIKEGGYGHHHRITLASRHPVRNAIQTRDAPFLCAIPSNAARVFSLSLNLSERRLNA